MKTYPEVTLEVNPLYTSIVGLRDLPWSVKDYCSVDYSYWTMDYHTRRKTIKSKKLNYLEVNRKTGDFYFPSGWWIPIKQVFEDVGFNVNVINNCPTVVPTRLIPNSLTLRDYQTPIVEKALEHGRGIIGSPTGSGKTVMYSYLLFKIGLPSLIITPSLNLFNQTYDELVAAVEDESLIGKIGEGEVKPSLITVSTIGTLWSRFQKGQLDKYFQTLKVLVIDESHHIRNSGAKPKNTYYKIVMSIPAPFRFGVTATPGKEGGLSRKLLEASTGPVIGEVASSTLIEGGYLTAPRIVLFPIEIESNLPWPQAYNENIIKNEDRNSLICHLAREQAAQNKSVLIICTRRDMHAKVLHQMMPESILMTGEDDTETRINLKSLFEEKKRLILVSTVIQEGVNIPSMDVIIMANAGKGGEEGVQQIQRVGRVMRPSDGKDKALVIDFIDMDGGVLERHSKARLSIYRSRDGYQYEIVKPADVPQFNKLQVGVSNLEELK